MTAEGVRQHGRFVSEGLNHHVHLSGFTKSRVAQFEIGRRWPTLRRRTGEGNVL